MSELDQGKPKPDEKLVQATANGPHSHATEMRSMTFAGERNQVYSDFMMNFWAKGGGLGGGRPQLLLAGDPSSLKGSLRQAHPVLEYIFDAVEGEMCQYTILKSFPVSTYCATIRFESAGDGKTKVSWKSEFTPLIPFTGALMKWFIENKVIQVVLENFQRKQQAKL